MSKVEIRAATPDDVPVMHRLLGELADFVGDSEQYTGNVNSFRRHGFGPDRIFHTLLAEESGNAVGLVNYFPEYSTWLGTPGVYILDLVVSRGARGGGLGRALLRETMTQAAAAWDARYVRLGVHGHNESAMRFYRGLGFRESAGESVLIADASALAKPTA